MEQIKLYKLSKLVEICLAENDKARNTDWILFRDVCKKLNLNVNSITINDMCENGKDFPTFESVTRTRRKIQAEGKYPATENVRKARIVNELIYREVMA